MHTSREYTSTYVSEFSFVFSTKSFAVEDTKKERKNTTSLHLPKTILAHALLYTTLVATTRLSFHGVWLMIIVHPYILGSGEFISGGVKVGMVRIHT